MLNLRLKISAIRLLRHLSQEEASSLAHAHIKTYQRKEAGKSAILEQDLVLLSVAFQCTIEAIQQFDLEANTFLQPEKARVIELEFENTYLKSGVKYLRELVGKFINSMQHKLNFGGEDEK